MRKPLYYTLTLLQKQVTAIYNAEKHKKINKNMLKKIVVML